MRYVLGAAFAVALLAAPAAQAATTIKNPVAFVRDIYAHVVGNAPEPDDIYSPRLEALFRQAKAEAGHDEIPRAGDFDYWTGTQDSQITDVVVSKIAVYRVPGRVIVVARFKDYGKPAEIHFFFEKTRAGWKVDDIRAVGSDPWVLSLMLKYDADTGL